MDLISSKHRSDDCQRLEGMKLQGIDQGLTLYEHTARPRRILHKRTRLLSSRSGNLQLRYSQKQGLKLISGFYLNADAFKPDDSRYRCGILYRKLKRLKNLSFLQIFAQRDAIYKLLAIAKSLRYLTNLLTLELTFGCYRNVTSQDIQNLSLCLRQLSRLTVLTLKFNHYTITDENFQQLLLCTRYLPSLISINPNFQYCDRTPVRALEALVPRQPTSSTLCSLTLTYSYQAMERLMTNLDLRRFTSLLVLNLSFDANFRPVGARHPGGFSDKCLESIAVSLLSLQSLLVFNLAFFGQINERNNVITNTGVESLCLSLKRLKLLNTLGLNFSARTDMLPEAQGSLVIIDIQKIIALISRDNMSLLSTLSLNFQSWSHTITEEDIISLSKAFRALNPLKTLNLNLSECLHTGGTALRYLSKSICYHTALQNLTLSFSRCRNITMEGIKRLSTSLEYLVCLESLDLDLSYCDRIGSKGMRVLFEHFKSLKKLRTLSLVFKKNIIAADLKSISDALIHISRLENFCLQISDSSKMTGKAMESLCEGLKHLTLLKFLRINIWSSDILTDKSLESLSGALAYLTLLSKLEIVLVPDYYNLRDSSPKSKFTKRGMRALVNSLRCFETLNILYLFMLLRDGSLGEDDLIEELRGFSHLWSVIISNPVR